MNRNKKVLTLSIVVVLMLSLSIFGAVSFDNVAQSESPAAENAEKVELTDLPQIDENAAPAEAEEPVVQVVSAKTDGAVTTTTTETTTTTTVPEKNEYINENGEVEIPYDQAFPEEFESGKVEYSDEAIMVKFDDSFGGKVNSELKKAGIAKVELMFELEDSAWYTATLKKDADVKETMAQVRELDDVVVAEYDFTYETSSLGEPQEISTAVTGNNKVNEQWYLRYCGIQNFWKRPEGITGKGTVVAVIDTGVDYDHIDLKANMWKNAAETPDNGVDDDGNGYVDDYYGVDVIAEKGNGDDDHGHGTHVAGIIAAANNKEGGVGIAYDAKIMAVKAGQSSGYFNQSDIAEAVIYAYENGADVINMSFGGAANSIAVQDALTVAYTRCILVAAAGNDGMHNEYYPGAKPSYPAALTYVLGVMSVGSSGVESGFTNYDVINYSNVEYELYAPGEEIFSTIPNDKYATWSGTSMAAPVVSAIAANLRSAYPDRNSYPTKFIYGQLASTSELYPSTSKGASHMIIDADAALNKTPKPNVNVTDYMVFDTKGFPLDIAMLNNGDGVVDAGETIALGFTLRNQWGMSKDTVVKIDAISPGGVACPYVTIHNDSVNYGGVGTYSTKDCGKVVENGKHVGWEDPFYITVSPDCPNDYIITLNVTVTSKNGLDETDNYSCTENSAVNLKIRRGTILPSKISEDMTLRKDNYYIIPNSTLIAEGVTVTVEPGTQIQFWSYDPEDPYADRNIAQLLVEGILLMDGTEDDPIYLFPCDSGEMGRYVVNIERVKSGYIRMKNCDITNAYINIDYAFNCFFRQNYAGSCYRRYLSNSVNTVETQLRIVLSTAEYCSFYNLGGFYDSSKAEISGNIYKNCIFADSALGLSGNTLFNNCVYLGNNNGKGNIGCSSYYGIGNEHVMNIEEITFGHHYYSDSEYIIPYSSFIGNLSEFVLRDFGIYLGGSLACVESEEELIDFSFVNPGYGFIIGLRVDDREPNNIFWEDNEYLDVMISDLKNNHSVSMVTFNDIYLRYDMNQDVFMSSAISTVPLYEFQLGDCPIKTSTDFTDKWVSFLASGEHNLFSGNAILNRFASDANVDNWLRVSALKSSNHNVIGIPNNYWGTMNEDLINKQIVDFDDYANLADIDPSGYFTEAPENVWPFVVDAGLIHEDGGETVIVGNETVTFYVDFNRDMDTTIPLSVRFGSAYPYADYQVEGEYVSPRRWEGTTTLSTLIENGTQYFNISNGACIPKEGEPTMELFTDWGRFTFEIDTTEALAMNLQAHATDTGIELTWFQDDFDTLAGYNVYRSTSEDGFYQKLNSTVIPADTKTFFDDTVEPGVVYYYNFTVVQTDFTESVPSGKQTIMAKDTMAPDMYHTPVYQAFTGSHIVINAMVTDNVAVQNVKLCWRTVGDEEYTAVAMDKLNDKYSAVIPEAMVTTAGIEYYIAAFDGNTYTYKGSADAPYLITVLAAVDENSKGDVNGDGQITNKDAVILLQGINDLYNLSAEEFARADINSDGELTAMEALRILKYVSGEISSVLF